jgi:hypothetical protein
MLNSNSGSMPQRLSAITKETLVKGRPAKMKFVEIGGQTYSISKGPATVVGLEDDWYEDVHDPAAAIEVLRQSRGFKPDIFTFLQRFPHTEPEHKFQMEFESVAALRVESYDYWWSKQAKGTTRNMVRKSQKAGVEVRETKYDDDFVRGMVKIFNETPLRQDRLFWHYGKDFETVKRQFSRFLFREHMIGAYYRDELIGFVMLGNAENYGVLGQIISMIQHRDKATNNALVAKTVEVCASKALPYLLYGFWSDSSLVDFKRHSGFQEARLPRYFVPITLRGKLALRFGLYRGWKAIVPNEIKNPLKRLRKTWHIWRAKRRVV